MKYFYILILAFNFPILSQNVLNIYEKLPVIETERIILRQIDLVDLQDIFEFSSDPEVVKLSGMFKLHTNIVEAEDFIKKSLDAYKNKSSSMWSVIHKTTNKVIGLFRLFSYIIPHAKAEIGYAYNRQFWNQGLATEVAKSMIDFGFKVLNLNRIQATADPRNFASLRVLEKAGMKYEGHLRHFYFLKDEFCDRKIYSILKSDYKE